MELIAYLAIFRRWWWLGLLPIVVSTAVSVTLTSRQPPRYETESTYLVVPRVGPDQAVSALNTLIGGVEINATYAAIVESDRIEGEVRERLGDGVSLSKISVSAEPVTGTNLVSVRVRGRDPDQVFVVASAYGAEVLEYADALDQPFALEALDSPSVPDAPVGDGLVMAGVIAGTLGAILGIVFALVAESISRMRASAAEREKPTPRSASATQFDIVDPFSGAYTESFFRMRLRQEIARADRGAGPLAVGVTRVKAPDDPPGWSRRRPTPADVATALSSTLREEDLVAMLDDGGFAILLPGMTASAARDSAKAWHAALSDLIGPQPASPVSIRVVTGTCWYENGSFVGNRVAARVARRLSSQRVHEGGRKGVAENRTNGSARRPLGVAVGPRA